MQTSDGGWVIVAPIVLAVCVLAVVVWFWYRRREAMRELAERHGLESLPGDFRRSLPGDFPFELLDKLVGKGWGKSWTGIRNGMGGLDGSDYIAAFDLRVRQGKSVYRWTVVARRSPGRPPNTKVPAGFVSLIKGEWQLVAREKRVFASLSMEPVLIEQVWGWMK